MIKSKNIDGRIISLEDFRGKVMLIVILPANADLLRNTKNWNQSIKNIMLWDLKFSDFHAINLPRKSKALKRKFFSFVN